MQGRARRYRLILIGAVVWTLCTSSYRRLAQIPRANLLCDACLRKRPCLGRYWFREFVYGGLDGGGDFVLGCVWEADVKCAVPVVLGQIHRAIDGFEDIRFNEITLSKHSHAGSVSIEEFAVLC